jgi:hypothetical protein
MAFADDYVGVPERIAEFRAKHPAGTLQSTILFTPGDIPGWVVEARAYRTPDDERPGYGLAFEPVPGKTNFTRDSELQNCETSAWGRALIAVGAADAKMGIASAEDVRNRSSEGVGPVVDGEATGGSITSEDVPPPSPVESASPGGGGDSPRKPTKEHLKPEEHDAVWADSPKLNNYEVCTFEGCLEVRRKKVSV